MKILRGGNRLLKITTRIFEGYKTMFSALKLAVLGFASLQVQQCCIYTK